MTRIVKSVALAAAVLTGGAALTACSTSADIASENISKKSDNFEILRRVVFINAITDKYLLTIEGFCSLDASAAQKVAVTCKLGPDNYKKDYLGLSDNVTYLVEQLDGANVSADHYVVNFKPESLVPDIQKR
ncbi:hypothetical protein ACFRAQ_34600 [Nocardia sp. NPDC056611]|uniref:beta-sandwich lipoprotein n=1 Tax=Nocardia sp. NPDC056611 TaxID=3345877 RepID=UPI00366C33F9